MSRILEKWTDEITVTGPGTDQCVILKKRTEDGVATKSSPLATEPVPLGLLAEIKRRTETAGITLPLTSTNDVLKQEMEVDEDEGDEKKIPKAYEADVEIVDKVEYKHVETHYDLLVKNLPVIKSWIMEHLRLERRKGSCKLSSLRAFLKGKLKEELAVSSLKPDTLKKLLSEQCQDIVNMKQTEKSLIVFLIEANEAGATEKQLEAPTAMSIMSQMSSFKNSSSKNQDTSKSETVSTASYISLLDDDKKDKKSNVIDLTEDKDPDRPLSHFKTPPLGSLQFGAPANTPQAPSTSKFGAFPVPSNLLKPSHGGVEPVKLGSEQIERDEAEIGRNQFVETRHDPSLPGILDQVIDLTVVPINKTKFETQTIDVRPVHVPYGKRPSREQVDVIAKECIEMLAMANESVTMERVEKLVCQRYRCYNIRQLGIQYTDQIPCINELNRLLCKVNLYVIAFVKSRSMCTLHELKESLRDYATENGDFESLKLGPLQRFPVVFQQFHFPTDLAEIPEITSMDILDHFHNYLTKFKLWSKRLELQPFMDYLVHKYEADDAYMLGCRIRSLPLAAAVLKKAHRDSRNHHRQIVQHFKEELKNEMGDAFRKFRASILQTGEGDGMEVREHYMKMRPELAIMEIFDKFSVLLMVTQVGDRQTAKGAKFRRQIEEFLQAVRDDDLCKNILHLALCMSNTAVEETAMEMLVPKEVDSDDEKEQKTTQNKPPPRKDALIESLKTYIERCLNAGAISLAHLDRIEEKMLEDFGYSAFSMMGYGRFIEFLLMEMKQMLEESGGLSLGSGGSDTDLSFKPHQTDILEFIKQCRQCTHTEPEQIEDALCKQYSVKEVRHLGYGNITRLLSYADKHVRHIYGECTVLYESSLVPSAGLNSNSGSKVGILGHQTRDAAKICLHNCPLLENMADWSQWGLVFEPELGKLKDFVQKYGGVTTKTLEGGKLATFDFLALELKPGEYIKVVSTTSPEHVATALENRDISATSGHLVSMAVAYKGVESMPLALLSGHVKTALLLMHAEDPSTDARTGKTSDPDHHKAAMFVLQCLLRIPTKICVSLANQIFLDPLGQVVGSCKSKELLVQLCKTVSEQNQLVQLGCLLGIPEWTDLIQQKCILPDSAIQILPPDAEELFGEVNPDQEEEEEEVEMFEDDGTEDVDEILAGDLGKDKATQKDSDTSKKTEDTDIKDKKTEEKELDVTEGTNEDVTLNEETKQDVADEQLQTKLCEDVVNQIRRDEFGVGIHLSEDGQRLMRVQQERLGRSLDRLSKDLYSKDTHFVLELVQNADDNSYHDSLLNNTTDECPSVKFVIEHDGIYVLNNELGFTEKDIRALCDVGRSTKGKHKFGYIGQKGIGFKSVFRITDAPEVHSNGYHIRFDVNSGPMGYILPHWVAEEERISQDEWMTHIILRLKPDMRVQTRTLAARFNDIHPSLLLFLHRLREITIENKVEKSVQTMRRRDVGDNVIEIQHRHGCERWLVIKKMLDARKISMQAKSGADVESTEIALAFPLKQQGQTIALKAMPPKQPVFAFLPLRSYGFRFIIQGDFDVPSSREDVDRDSPWNQWLRNEIHVAFFEALEVFKTHPEFNSMEAVCTFLQFVPMEDEVLDFFKPVASDILKKLRAKPCVPTQPNSQGVVSWKIPSQTVRVRDPLVRSVITADQLQTHLNLFYLHSDVAAMLNPTLTSCLGIETLTSDHLFQLGKALVVNMGTHYTKEEDIILIAKWMACMYRSLDEFHQDDMILKNLKCSRILPLVNGELVALQDKTVFYPIEDASSQKNKKNDTLNLIQQDINSLHPLLLNTDDDEVNSQVHKLLLRIGIKQLSPFDVINHHIIPVMKSDIWQTKSNEMLVAYLIYIKEQTEKQNSVCNIEEIKDVAMVKTDQGFKNPTREPVHFPPKYGNSVKLQEKFSGYDWTLLHDCYLPEICSQPMIVSWMEFFKKLGVEEFLSIRQTEIHLTREDVVSSPWSEYSSQWPNDKTEFVIHDYHCAELEGLIMRNRIPAGDMYADQMKYLCTYLDKNWESKFSKYCTTHVHDKDGIPIKETCTSFSILLKTAKWLPATQTITSQRCDGTLSHKYETVMKEPSCLYLRSDAVKKLLSDKVLYLNVQIAGESFYQFLGLKNTVSIETVKEYVLKWCERTTEGSAATLCTSLEHMRNVYSFLGKELKRKEFQDLLREKPVFFVPDKSSSQTYNKSECVSGKLLNRNEIWFSDKTGLFDKYRQILEEFHSDICRKRTIEGFYSDKSELVELFKQEGKLDQQPKVEEYLELLCLLCSTSSPKDARILSDVLYIFSTIGQALVTGPEGMPDEQTANMALDALKSTVRTTLQKKKVFPTSKQVWVSVEDKPLIGDNRELEKMFWDKPGVHFLDMEDQATKILKAKKGKAKVKKGTLNVFDSQRHQEWIDEVVEVCGIKKLSEVLDIEPTPDMIEPCKDLQLYFSKIIPYIQQYLMARYSDVYQELEQIKTKDMLKDAKFFQAGKLEVSYWLTSMTKDTFVVQEVKCNITPPEFYFHKDHVAAVSEINKEVAKYFSRGDSECNTALRSFLSECSNIISGVTAETIEAVLQRHEADGIEVADDEKWVVEPPLIEIPVETPPEPEEEEAVVETEVQQETGPEVKREEPFEMRHWPPVGDHRNIHQGGTQDRISKGRLPREAHEYRQSLRNLPTNIRLVDKEEYGETVDSTESGTKDNESKNKLNESDEDTDRIERRKRKLSSCDEEGSVKRQSKEGRREYIHDGKHTEASGDERSTRGNRGEGHYRSVNMEGQSGRFRDEEAGPASSNEESGHKPKNDEDDSDRQKLKHRQNEDDDQHDDNYQYQRRQRRRGDPIWSTMATEYTFDELGYGEDLPVPLNLEEGAADPEIGRWGEQLVAHYLEKQKELGNIIGYLWRNKEEEAGFPFDFEVQIQDENGTRKDYIEVKSTQSSDKEVFQISVQQIKFADEKGDGFHIYRVFNAGHSEKVRLIRITDLNMRLSTKQVKLCMMI
ncbi:uncharacterized protein LOC123550539 [Mercenaria mercenaria]|uniref:uncharacterized protein LOC123550539 n=1 Tax=Mercenaria mercenaria TaxID=6596 RepID=UPI00234E8E64|nr:uncharacterized protein LOC123550539 [Mercenaria mercenaria]